MLFTKTLTEKKQIKLSITSELLIKYLLTEQFPVKQSLIDKLLVK